MIKGGDRGLLFILINEKKMFRKGIVTFFDEKSAKGLIELKTDQQQVVFKLDDFSNQTILPQIGERIKCVVLEQHGELLAKFIVRLDYKNSVNDLRSSLAITHLYEENSYENVRNARKIHKKRRLIVEDESYSKIAKQTEQNTLAESQHRIEHEISQTRLTPPPNEQLEQQLESVDMESAQDLITPFQVKDIQPIATTTVLQNLSLTEDSEHTKNKQNLEQTELEVAGTHSAVESFNSSQVTQKKKPIKQSKRVGLLDFTYVDQMPERDDNQQQVTEQYQTREQQQIRAQQQTTEQYQAIEQKQTTEQQPKSDIDAVQPLIIASETANINHSIDQDVFQKHMSLNGLQRFYQNIKVHFLYSKRKQPKKKIVSENRIRFNPWFVIIGILLLIGVNCAMYAMDRYKQYKIETAMKLAQYQQQQKDVIKQQKRATNSR
jgi:cold shock CspA family protein